MTTVDAHITTRGSAYSGRSGAEYAHARAHSRRVRLLKIAFPLASLIVIIGFIMLAWLARLAPTGIEIERSTLENGTIVMENPVLTGQTADDRSFTVNAEEALQAITAPDVIRLRAVTADLPLGDDDATARVEAESGIYNRAGETLRLDAPFTVRSSDGVSVDMEGALFDLAEGAMESETPISITSGDTGLVADRVRMRDNGGTIIFERNVRMTIDPSTVRNSDRNGD